MNQELIDIICCPDTKQSLIVCERPVVKQLNRAIKDGRVKNVGGERVRGRIDEALIREDGKVVYPVRHSIPILLIHEGIETAVFEEK